MTRDIEDILDFLRASEALKSELRHSWLSDGRQESVADHCWMMALFAIVLHEKLEDPPDLGKTIQLVVVHDLAEALTGDTPAFEISERQKRKGSDERKAIQALTSALSPKTRDTILGLWEEYERGTTLEARFARALDRLEVQNQHNLADISTWTEPEFYMAFSRMNAVCAHDAGLQHCAHAIEARSQNRMRASGVDPTPFLEAAASLTTKGDYESK